MATRMIDSHWLHGFNYNVEEWFEGDRCEMLAICRNLAIARDAFKAAIGSIFRFSSHNATSASDYLDRCPRGACLALHTNRDHDSRVLDDEALLPPDDAALLPHAPA